MFNPAGWPRPTYPRDGRTLPMPWIGADGPRKGAWAQIDHDRTLDARQEKLCIVCGLGLGTDFVFALYEGRSYGPEIWSNAFDWLTVPTHGHPRCMMVAVVHCPYLKKLTCPVALPDGTKLTVDELRSLVQSKKSSEMSELPT